MTAHVSAPPLAGVPPRYPRVVHLVQTLSGGGAETAVRLLCAGLPGAGIETSVVSVYPSGLDAAARGGLGVPVLDLARGGRGDYGYFPRLVAALRRIEPDVVHAHLHTGQYPGRIAAMLARVPKIVLTIHGHEPGGPVRWALDRVLHARTARFVVFTQTQRARFAREQGVPAERVVVIPNGALGARPAGTRESLRRDLGIPHDAFAIYSIGRLAEEKNHTALLAGFASAARLRGGKPLYLILAGGGPLQAALRRLAESLGIAKLVRFLGFRNDAPQLCSAMDLFTLCSFREGMPLALGEAMRAGLAPVVTPWVDHDAFVRDGENGYVAAAFDGAAIGAALIRACADPRRAEKAAVARERALRLFDPEAMVDAHARLYRELAGS